VIAWFAGQPLPTRIGLAILAGALLGGLAILSYFRVRKFLELKALKDLEVKERVGLKIEFIKTAAQILGGAFFLVTIYVAWQNLVVSQEKHKTDLFTKAIEQLGSEKLEVRLGGIYALERIARDSEKDHGPIMEVLTAYVRENAPWPPEKPAEAKEQPAVSGKPAPGVKKPVTKRAPEVKPRADIQAILTVIGRRTRTYGKGETQPLDLSRTDLRGVFLREAHLEAAFLFGVHLEGASLRKAHLEEAFLVEARLEGAHLEEAHLEGADLRRAHLGCGVFEGFFLEGANLKGADLTGANLMRAQLGCGVLEGFFLQGAYLKGADLRGAKGLTKEQIASAITDETTELPEYLKKADPEKAKP